MLFESYFASNSSVASLCNVDTVFNVSNALNNGL